MNHRYMTKLLTVLATLSTFGFFGAINAPALTDFENVQRDKSMEFKIPQSLKVEHAELHQELAKAVGAGGKVAEAAKVVAELLHAHFVKEEEYALPPLGLLSSLAEGKEAPEMRIVIAMSNKLKADLPHMLQEHKAIVAALHKLVSAAKQENKPEHAHFAEKLILHAQNEEEVLYPAAILVGEYLKLKLGEVK
jgi:Hemerythrin HHE cation binding domain